MFKVSCISMFRSLSSFRCIMTFPSSLGFSTRAVHSGQEPDPVTGAVIPPITLSATFKIDADTSKV